jgi:hypothetical protein
MYHENTWSKDASHFSKDWKDTQVYSANDVAQLCVKNNVAPTMWEDGRRLKIKFRFAEWIGLDFDAGMTLEEAVKVFDKYLHVIGTTKNHQRDKGGIICDRFRVFLKLEERCNNRSDYEHTLKLLIEKFGADKCANGTHRFFFKCTKIIQVGIGGELIPIKITPKSELKKQENIEKRNVRLESYYKPYKIIPPRARKSLADGCANGERNDKCFSIACDLFRVGYSFDEVFDLLWKSAIPLNGSDDTYKDVLKAVNSARKSF